MWPHGLLGLSWAELAALVTIIGALFMGARKMYRSFSESIAKPLLRQLGELSKAIDDLSRNSLTEHHAINGQLQKHEQKIERHDYEIGTLYSTVGLTRRRKGD